MVNQIPIVGPTNIDELNELASRPTDGVRGVLADIDSDILVLGAGGKMGFHLSWMLQRALNEIGSEFRVRAVSRFADPGEAGF